MKASKGKITTCSRGHAFTKSAARPVCPKCWPGYYRSKKAKTAPKTAKHVVYHKDGSVWAKGKMNGGECDGYWEWFRKDGTKMRSGHFKKGKRVGEWITYDKKGQVYKITQIK